MSKSRGERKTPAQLQPTSIQVSNDVVPGRFTENDWTHMVDEETEEDFVSDILQEVVASALDQIYYKIIEQRIIPYTVNAAKDLLLEVIEWQFLVKDPGNTGVNEDKTWLEDEEPEPAVTDSWAQGIIPVLNKEETPVSACIEEEVEIMSEPSTSIADNIMDDGAMKRSLSSPNSLPDQTYTNESSYDTRIPLENDSNNSAEKMQHPEPPSKPKQKNAGRTYKTYRGRVPSFRSITMTPITDERSMLKQQRSENETAMAVVSSGSNIQANFEKNFGLKDIIYDQKGNIVNMQKLNMDMLPSHRVKIKFAVVDPVEEEFKAKLANSKQRYSLHKNGSPDNRKNATCLVIDTTSTKENDLKLVSPLPPPLVDTINVAPGVVIKEKGVIKRGIRQPLNQYQSLEPLGSTFKAAEDGPLADGTSSVVRMNRNKPLPAIGTRD